MSEPRHPTEHVTTLSSNDMGYYARCTCGWEGRTRDRMSDDYAWTNACDDVKSHERTHKAAARTDNYPPSQAAVIHDNGDYPS